FADASGAPIELVNGFGATGHAHRHAMRDSANVGDVGFGVSGGAGHLLHAAFGIELVLASSCVVAVSSIATLEAFRRHLHEAVLLVVAKPDAADVVAHDLEGAAIVVAQARFEREGRHDRLRAP